MEKVEIVPGCEKEKINDNIRIRKWIIFAITIKVFILGAAAIGVYSFLNG